jgi:HAE1 family hydrophobic/amphiphilic exporter-1
VRSDGDAILDGRGLSPAALGLGAGSDTNGPLAVAVIGGLVSSTLLTLVVIPSVYSLMENRISRFHKNVIQ